MMDEELSFGWRICCFFLLKALQIDGKTGLKEWKKKVQNYFSESRDGKWEIGGNEQDEFVCDFAVKCSFKVHTSAARMQGKMQARM